MGSRLQAEWLAAGELPSSLQAAVERGEALLDKKETAANVIEVW